MGKVNAMASNNQLSREEEWEQKERELLLSQGYTEAEINVIIDDMINEYNYEMAMDHGVWE